MYPAPLQIYLHDAKEWFGTHKLTPPAPPLHPSIQRVIEQWFALVDDDGSGTLDHSELLAALTVGQRYMRYMLQVQLLYIVRCTLRAVHYITSCVTRHASLLLPGRPCTVHLRASTARERR